MAGFSPMSFDGIPKPSQVTPYTDAMNSYAAANAARSDRAGKPLVKGPDKEEKVKGAQRDERQYHEPDEEDEPGEAFSEEEAEQIKIFARMRGLMNFALETGLRYEFQINSETGLVDLLEIGSGKVVLQLLPEELMQLSQKIQRYDGMLTDRSG
jgi:uncharacterized FlaG/YvyC family protein